MEEAVSMSPVFTFFVLIAGPGLMPEDAGTSDSAKKIRPGHNLNITVFASSIASIL